MKVLHVSLTPLPEVKNVGDMVIKKGMMLEDVQTGRVIQVISKASDNKHWNCKCGKKSHKVHEGTLRSYYLPATGNKECG